MGLLTGRYVRPSGRQLSKLLILSGLALLSENTAAHAVTLTLSTSDLHLEAGAGDYARGSVESLSGVQAFIDPQGSSVTLSLTASAGGTLSQNDLKIRCTSGVATDYAPVSTVRPLWSGKGQGVITVPLDLKVDNLRSYSSGSYSQTLIFTITPAD